MDRGYPTALTRDFNQTSSGAFAVDVPNGTYDVTITSGDRRDGHDRNNIYLEGALVGTINTVTGEFVTRTYRVDVADSQLTLDLMDTGGRYRYAVINALVVTAVAAPVDVTGAQITAAQAIETSGSIDRVGLTFSEAIDEATFTIEDVQQLTGPAGVIAATAVNKLSDTQYEVTFASQSLRGGYTLALGPEIRDLAGNAIDQDGDGLNGEATDDQFATSFALAASTFHVAPGGNDTNAGTSQAPFRMIARSLAVVQPGDTVVVRDGTYTEHLTTRTAATGANRITIRAENAGGAIVTLSGRVLDIDHPHYTFEGLVFDGQFGASDIVDVSSAADSLILRDVIVRNGTRDGIDMSAPDNVLIENSTIHDLLWFVDGVREDAHGIVTAGIHNFTIRGTEVYYVSGDALQLQYDAWDNVLVVDSHFWNGDLPEARAGAPAGMNPGEDGIDTKQETVDPRGRLTVRNSVFHGWRSDFITNSAALNMKDNVQVLIDGVTFYDNTIGVRARGPGEHGGAHVTIQNSVFYDNTRAIRYEDAIEVLHVYNNTFGSGNSSFFQSAGGAGADFEVFNNLFLAGSKPSVASDSSNLAVNATSFVNAAAHDYHLVQSSPAVDAGRALSGVQTDRDGNSRPDGAAYDVGAYEFDEVFQSLGGLLDE